MLIKKNIVFAIVARAIRFRRDFMRCINLQRLILFIMLLWGALLTVKIFTHHCELYSQVGWLNNLPCMFLQGGGGPTESRHANATHEDPSLDCIQNLNASVKPSMKIYNSDCYWQTTVYWMFCVCLILSRLWRKSRLSSDEEHPYEYFVIQMCQFDGNFSKILTHQGSFYPLLGCSLPEMPPLEAGFRWWLRVSSSI